MTFSVNFFQTTKHSVAWVNIWRIVLALPTWIKTFFKHFYFFLFFKWGQGVLNGRARMINNLFLCGLIFLYNTYQPLYEVPFTQGYKAPTRRCNKEVQTQDVPMCHTMGLYFPWLTIQWTAKPRRWHAKMWNVKWNKTVVCSKVYFDSNNYSNRLSCDTPN